MTAKPSPRSLTTASGDNPMLQKSKLFFTSSCVKKHVIQDLWQVEKQSVLQVGNLYEFILFRRAQRDFCSYPEQRIATVSYIRPRHLCVFVGLLFQGNPKLLRSSSAMRPFLFEVIGAFLTPRCRCRGRPAPGTNLDDLWYCWLKYPVVMCLYQLKSYRIR